jgi:hypothetical protein
MLILFSFPRLMLPLQFLDLFHSVPDIFLLCRNRLHMLLRLCLLRLHCIPPELFSDPIQCSPRTRGFIRFFLRMLRSSLRFQFWRDIRRLPQEFMENHNSSVLVKRLVVIAALRRLYAARASFSSGGAFYGLKGDFKYVGYYFITTFLHVYSCGLLSKPSRLVKAVLHNSKHALFFLHDTLRCT